MIDKEKEVLNGFLKKIYNVTDEDLASLYNEAGELTTVDSILAKDSERISKFKTEKNDQFKAGQKKTWEQIEKHLKEKYSAQDSELLGAELIDHVFETQTAELQEKISKKFKDEDIEKHPSFIAKRKEWEKTLQSKESEFDEKLKAKETEWNRSRMMSKISEAAMLQLESNFILPENAVRAKALKDVLIRELESENYSIQDDGSIIILDKEGKAKEDSHGKMINFNEYIEASALKFFDKKVANSRGNAGNQNQNNAQQIVIKDQSDFQAKMSEAKTPEDRAAIMTAAKAAGIVKN